MKLNSYSHAILFFQISILVCTSSKSQAEIELNAVILQGTRGGCHFDTITARADLKTSVEYLVSEYAESLNKVCGCGYSRAGWKRVVFLNMTDNEQTCPGEWRLVNSPRRTCRRSHDSACSLASFSTNGVSYNEVCGRLVGYQYGSTDALWHPINYS